MPEPPDFEKMARAVVPFCLGIKNSDDVVEACGLVAEQLRQVWNARGAADIARLETEIPEVWTSPEPAGPLTRALRSLDR